jgi:ATP-dependent Lon protease
METEKIIEMVQKIIDKLSMIICGFGTTHIEDLLFISLGSEYTSIKIENEQIKSKYDLIRKHIHPTGYKIIHWKQNRINQNNLSNPILICANKITEDVLSIEDSNMFECFDVESSIKLFYQKIYGIRVIIQSEKFRKTLIINGIIDDIQLECFDNSYIAKRKADLLVNANQLNSTNEREIMWRIIDTLTLKDILIFGNGDIFKKMFAIFAEINTVKNNKLDVTIKRFLEMDVLMQRSMLINLLIYNKEDEVQYTCYLLYDLISVNTTDNLDTTDQLQIYDSLPWKIKQFFKDTIKYTIKYTNEMVRKYDISRITLEQQIYLLKVNENVKEKAMAKLKEIKGKPDEMGTKTKQYLEGLIKIPFGVYKEEPILTRINELNQTFQKIMVNCAAILENTVDKKDKYTIIEMYKYIKTANVQIIERILLDINAKLDKQNVKQITSIAQFIKNSQKPKNDDKLSITKQSKSKHIHDILQYLNNNTENAIQIYDFMNTSSHLSVSKTINDIDNLENNIKNVEVVMNNIVNVLDESIYGHRHAKNQILKIISQWMSGEQTGYCFGFEGSPGIGKTSLAKKGLAYCLKDHADIHRPFSFIALGGSANGSMLEGHGYTYVNSMWGKIVDILMDSKCMNPIIYIDELDKVSNTDAGKEIIGILTHLIDPTQNDNFQDKYFSGIQLDLSKALFIFSYNDPELIDRILLDRIHRVKFDNLTVDDKIVIVNKFILPEINGKMGFKDIVEISTEVIEFIVENYTLEPGVRKLKEILFDLYGEINIEILKCKELDTLPIVITPELLETKYLINYHKIQEKHIHENNEIGVINGLWANALGKGGIIPIQGLFFPSSTFLDLKLTGLKGAVMKESMNVAKTLAWSLTPLEMKKEWLKYFEETKCQGLHIHCPEGAVSKDGPSAGTAITIAIYSLFNKKPIINTIAMTGEINLQGYVTAIGGLDLKILGGIQAGVTKFLYPESNQRDFQKFIDVHGKKKCLENIEFVEVGHINNVFEHVFAE